MHHTAVITTFSKDHINLYGKCFVETFTRYSNLPLYVFAEDFSSEDIGFDVLDYFDHIPEQKIFKEHIEKLSEGLLTKPQNRLRKALRWSYKSFAILYALKHIESKYVVWIDADVETLSSVPSALAQSLCQDKLMMCYPQTIDQELHIESGFVIFNKQHDYIEQIINHYEQGYLNQKILDLNKPWDGFWLGKLISDNQKIARKSQLEYPPFRNISPFFKHHVGKEKFKETGLNKFSGRLEP
jgi:hypothetical protein